MADNAPGPWWKRLGWLALIWALSVGLIGIVAMIIRSWLGLG